MKKFRKVLALVIAMIMLVSVFPITSAGALSVYPEMELDTMYEVACDSKTHSYTFRPQEDGWYKFVSSGDSDPLITLYDKFLREVGYSDDGETSNFELVAELTKDELYYVKVSTWESEEGTFAFEVKKAVVATSLEIVSMPYDTTVIEGYEYDTADLDGLEIEFTISDGSKVLWDLSSDFKVGDDYVFINFDFDENGVFCVEISCGGAYTKIPYTVAESNIESIEYSCDEEIVFYENSNGYFVDELGYYVYNSYVPDNATIIVNYTDGTSEEFSYLDTLNGIEFFMYDTQDEQPWVVGGENYIYFSYLDKEVAVPVSIISCPIAGVTVNSAPEKAYYFGDENNGYFDYYGTYKFYPYDLSGLSFTVEYTDGTTKTYTDEDIDYYNGLIDGYSYELSEVECSDVGVYTATVSYKGYKFSYDVEVIETTVESIEVVKEADKMQYESYYYPILDGMQLKVNFKDGTSKLIDVTAENTSYIMEGDIVYVVDSDSDELRVATGIDDDFNEYYSFNYLGYTEHYYGFEFVETRTVEDIQFENVSGNGDKMVATVTYEDGSVDELTFDVLASEEYDTAYYEAYAMTENGIAYYDIEKYYDKDGAEWYTIYFLDDYYDIKCVEETKMMGDVDGDGNVTIMDASEVQRHIAQLKLLDDSMLDVADVDSNGAINILDVTRIQRYVAKMITEF